MYARPVETVEEKNIQSRTLPAPPKRSFSFASRRTSTRDSSGPSSSSSSLSRSKSFSKTEGPSSYSMSRSAGRSSGENDDGHPHDGSLAATSARSTRRPVRAFQKIDEDVYDGFLNCTKKTNRASRGFRRMGTLG